MRTTLFHDATRDEAERHLRSALNRANGARAAIRDAAVSMLHDIPGLSGMRHVHGSTRRPAVDVLTIGVTGWSPTLHVIQMTETVRMTPGDAGVDEAIALASRVVATLTERARDADTVGLDTPASTTSGPPRLDHLVIDRSLAEIVRTRAGGCVVTGCVNALRDAHRQHATFAPYVHDKGARGVERVRDPALPVIRELSWAVSVGGREFPRYDGAVLSLKAQGLPVTVTQAMPGRRLRDLVRAHPALDDRIVRELHVDDLGGGQRLYTFTFEPETVSVADWIS